MHRLCKARLLGIEEMDAVQLPALPAPRWRVLANGEEVEIASDSRGQGAEPIAPDIRTATGGDAEAASALVIRSFNEWVAADWEPAAGEALRGESTPDAMFEKIAAATYTAAAFAGEEMIGFLLMPRATLLAILFVHPQWMRRGVGRALWENARAHLQATCPEARTVELNATPYAVPFYRALGFVPLSAEFVRAGCRITRMACWLPARGLGAECGMPGAGH
jgi:GNAT superfamily N-acetyltransferase